MSKLLFLALGGAAVYLLSKKSDGAASATPLISTPNIVPGSVIAPAPLESACDRWAAWSNAANEPGLSVSAWVGPIPICLTAMPVY